MTWINNASVAAKVALAPAFAIVCLALVGAIGFFANERLSSALTNLGDVRVPSVVIDGALSEQVTNIHALVNQSLAWEGAGYKADKIAVLDKRIEAELTKYAKNLADRLDKGNLSESERKHLAVVQSEFGKYSKNAKDALDIKSGMVANAASYMTTMEGNYLALKTEINSLLAEQTQLSAQASKDGQSLALRNKTLIVGGFALSALATIAISWFMSRLIVQPLTQASLVAEAVAGFDLRERPHAESTDATGQVLKALGTVSENLSGIVLDIRASADLIHQASSEIASGNNDLSNRTELQARNLQQTAASMGELNDNVHNGANKARQATDLASSASQAAINGNAVFGDVVRTMEDISQASRKIVDIIAVIDGIAFQTNILALNAAVEAARAGEQGRGFAVVASEVRSLAGRSAEAAKEIKTLITTSVEKIETGSRLVGEANGSMTNIVDQVKRVANLIGEVSASAHEQAGGIDQVNQAVAQLDQVTQQNAALVEEAAAAASSLNQQATRMVDTVSVFKLTESSLVRTFIAAPTVGYNKKPR